MKPVHLLGALLATAALAGCNQPNNGEIPPAGELPTPYPAQTAQSAPRPAAPATPAGATSATPAPAGSNAAPAPAASTPATGASTGQGR